MLLLEFIGAVDKILFIKLKLQNIHLTRELFLLEANLGQETYIPDQLQQTLLPYSYRYYDFLVLFLKENLSQEIREKVLFKCSLYNSLDNSNEGVINRNDLARRQLENCLEHNQNHYASALQTSKFIKVSDNVATLENNVKLG